MMQRGLFPSLKYRALNFSEIHGPLVQELLLEGERSLNECLLRRPVVFDQIGLLRTELDARAATMQGQQREMFAFAMADFQASRMLAWELPLFATAYRLSNDQRFLDRTIRQLDELSTWVPMQRSGWSLCSPTADGSVENGFCDGSWLATGELIRAISETLAILPPTALPESLSHRIAHQMSTEIDGILEDWESRRGWFRSEGVDGVPATNQWVLPTEGLILGALLVGQRPGDPAYEFGVANLIRALDVQGNEGEFNEGFAYSSFTVRSFLSCAGSTAAVGDFRIKNHPFLKNYPQWFVHHFQPAQSVINAFDCGGGGQYDKDSSLLRSYLSIMVCELQSEVAQWALEHFFTGPSANIYGLVVSASQMIGQAPPTFGHYSGPASRFNWVSSWDSHASGLWVRGGHESDAHDHQDRGHLSFNMCGVPILIETGTPNYAHPRLAGMFRSEKGHNVLEVEGCVAKRAIAPIQTHRVSHEGGFISVDGSEGYPSIDAWIRTVEWTSQNCSICDTVSAQTPQRITFRWHLAAAEVTGIIDNGVCTKFDIVAAGFRVELTSSQPMTVESTQEEDATIDYRDGGSTHLHICLLVQTLSPVTNWVLVTNFFPPKKTLQP